MACAASSVLPLALWGALKGGEAPLRRVAFGLGAAVLVARGSGRFAVYGAKVEVPEPAQVLPLTEREDALDQSLVP